MNSFKMKLFISVIFSLCFIFPLSSEEEYIEKNKPLDGDLLLPEGYNNIQGDETAEEMKCITVCNQWGEDCIINPSRNSGARKCRRVCKSFADRCF